MVEAVAKELRQAHVDAWLDKWEIRPGDSLIEKIFRQGLDECEVFAIFLSPTSVQSRWVKEELDVALIQRIEGVTRVVPVVLPGEYEVPVPLKPLFRLRIESAADVGGVCRELADVAHGRDTVRPPLGPAPDPLVFAVPDLTDLGARMGDYLLRRAERSATSPMTMIQASDFADELQFSPEQVNEGAYELERLGLVRKRQVIGTAPFDFWSLEARYPLWHHFASTPSLDYDPGKDVVVVAALAQERRSVTAKDIALETGYSVLRINNAVDFLEDYGLVSVRRFMGTMPFAFGAIERNHETKRFVKDNS